jgi:DNA-binding transcriptional LysR family regulator
MNNLSNVDLNLLVVLDALLTERHVSRAALRLHKSQPAISHALSRLRDLLDDPLLVRHGGKLIPTARALEIAPALSETLSRMQALLAPSGFDPATEHRTIRIAMSDYGASILLPGLLALLRKHAPNIDLVVSQASREVMLSQIADGEIDLALGVFQTADPRIKSRHLFEETFACLADMETLPSQSQLSLSDYCKRPHMLVALRSDINSEIDVALAKMGQKRRIIAILPHWSIAPSLIRGTDLVLTVARRTLPHRPETQGLQIFDPPFAIPSFPFRQIWHERRDGDPIHRWLREQVAGILSP